MRKKLLFFLVFLSCLHAQTHFHQYYTYCMHSGQTPIVFHNIPKNASNFLKKYLFDQNDAYGCYFRSNLHLKPNLVHTICVRDPLYRPISIYHEILKLREDCPYKVTRKMQFYKERASLEKSFELFLDEIDGNFYDQHLSHQFLVLAKKSLRLEDMDFVFLFENLDEDVQTFAKKYPCNMPEKPLNTSSQSLKSRLEEFIDRTPRIQKKIRKLWARDFVFYKQAKERRLEVLFTY